MPTTITGTTGNDTITNTTPGAIITALDGDDIINDTGPAASVDGGAGIDTLNLDLSGTSTPLNLTYSQPDGGINSQTLQASNIEMLNLTTGSGNDFAALYLNRVDCTNTWNAGAGTDTFSFDGSQLITQGSHFITNGITYSVTYVQCTSKGIWVGAQSAADGKPCSFRVATLSNVENFSWAVNVFGPALMGAVLEIGTAGSYSVFDGNNSWLTFDTTKATGGVTVDLNHADVETFSTEPGDWQSGHWQKVGGGFGALWLANPIRVRGTQFNDTLIGDAAENVFEGGSGDDTIDGGLGYDAVQYLGNRSAYTITANTGGGYTITGPDGTDTLISIENVYFFGGETVTLANAGAPLGHTVNGTSNAELLSGACGDDIIHGGAGEDRVVGLEGNDTLFGDADNDRLEGWAGDDILDGGTGVDSAYYSGAASSYTITQTSTGVFKITGPDGTDTLTNVESVWFGDLSYKRLLPGTGTSVTWTADPSTYMGAIRDFDGNDLGGAASWKLIGTADVNGDGSAEHILFNKEIGRWAEVGTQDHSLTYFANYSWGGDTRVVGIYIDPLVANGTVVKGSATDSQRRFQNDLFIDNIKTILGQADYNHDGLQEVYFSLTDGTAYLHAYMHADGNIQYANYQSKQQVIDYLTANGVASSTWATWFPASQAAMEVVSSTASDLVMPAGTTAWAAVTGG